MSETSFVALAQDIIRDMAADTDAESSLNFKTTTYTRLNPWEAPASGVEVEENVTGFVFGPGTRRANGELVEQDSRVVYVAAADLTQTTLGLETTMVVAGKEFVTDRFNRIPEGDNPALYEIFIGLG